MDVAGQVVIVTGSATGIGAACVRQLAARGARVVVNYSRNAEAAEATAQACREAGGEALVVRADVAQDADCRRLAQAALDAWGRIDGLVNNAGGQFPAPLSAISQKGFETVVRTNLVGGFLMAREVYNQAMSERGGAIVNIVADMWRSMPGMGHSGAARAGMVNFTQTAAVEWAAAGVRVNAVAPGWIASSGLDHYEGAAKALIPRLKASVPLGRLGTEAECSAAICFLLSEAAAFISGTTLRVDGAAPNASLIWPIQEHDRSAAFDGFHRAQLPEVLR